MNKNFKKVMLTMSALAVFSCNIAFANPVVVDYYYGEGCGYCKQLKPWLDEYESQHKEDVKINRHEIWNNQENNKKFQDHMAKFDVPAEERGTPTAVVNNKVLIGSKVIHDELNKEVQNAKTNPNKEPIKYVPLNPQPVPQEQLPQIVDPKVDNQDKDAYCYEKLTKNLNLGLITVLSLTTLGSLLYIVHDKAKKKEIK